MSLDIPSILAQMPTSVSSALPFELDELADYACAQWVACGHAQREAAPMLTHDARGWSVVIDGTTDKATRRQGGSRGGWPKLRLALLAAILLAHRPELPISGRA